jgi:hypothetical protein
VISNYDNDDVLLTFFSTVTFIFQSIYNSNYDMTYNQYIICYNLFIISNYDAVHTNCIKAVTVFIPQPNPENVRVTILQPFIEE